MRAFHYNFAFPRKRRLLKLISYIFPSRLSFCGWKPETFENVQNFPSFRSQLGKDLSPPPENYPDSRSLETRIREQSIRRPKIENRRSYRDEIEQNRGGLVGKFFSQGKGVRVECQWYRWGGRARGWHFLLRADF